MLDTRLRTGVLPALCAALAVAIHAAPAEAEEYRESFESGTGDWVQVERVPSGRNGVPSRSGRWHAESRLHETATFWDRPAFASELVESRTEVAFHLDMARNATLGTDLQIDFLSAINRASPNGEDPREWLDFGIHIGTDPTTTGRFVAGIAPRCHADPSDPANQPQILDDGTGWYRVRHTFAEQDGELVVGIDVLGPSGQVVASWEALADLDGDGEADGRIAASDVGNTRYGFMCHDEFDFLAIDDASKTELDRDRDGFWNDEDTCPDVANPDQVDSDGDGAGDACDTCVTPAGTAYGDQDGDGIEDHCDACPKDAGNDADGDEVCGDVDVCPSTHDPEQSDGDGDGVGDACDLCPTGDDPSQGDSDGDGVGDVCDVCRCVADPDQADSDGDGAGDACDASPLPLGLCRQPFDPAKAGAYRGLVPQAQFSCDSPAPQSCL